MTDPPHQVLPVVHLQGAAREPQLLHDQIVEMMLGEPHRHFVDGKFLVHLFNDGFGFDVAEESDLLAVFAPQRPLGSHDQNVGLNTDLPQLADAVLRRLGLGLAGRLQVRHQREVHEQAILLADVERDLPDGLEERQPLDVAHRAAELRDHHVDARRIEVEDGRSPAASRCFPRAARMQARCSPSARATHRVRSRSSTPLTSAVAPALRRAVAASFWVRPPRRRWLPRRLGLSLPHAALAPSGQPIWLDAAARSARAILRMAQLGIGTQRRAHRRGHPQRHGAACGLRRIDEPAAPCSRRLRTRPDCGARRRPIGLRSTARFRGSSMRCRMVRTTSQPSRYSWQEECPR